MPFFKEITCVSPAAKALPPDIAQAVLIPIFAAFQKATMQYREIVAVTGLGGLYQLLGTKSDGAIVRALAENTTKFISSRQHNVTPLESIEIYTNGDNVRLHEVFEKMKDSEQPRPEAKAKPEDIRAYFREVYPDMDEDRVYISDMKKMLKWFEVLKSADLLDFSSVEKAAADEAQPTEAEATGSTGEAQVAEHEKAGDISPEAVGAAEEPEKPAKKARAKKATDGEKSEEEMPAKKTARKKAEPAQGDESAPKKTAKAKKKEEE